MITPVEHSVVMISKLFFSDFETGFKNHISKRFIADGVKNDVEIFNILAKEQCMSLITCQKMSRKLTKYRMIIAEVEKNISHAKTCIRQ